MNKRFLVESQLPYRHLVQVSIEAESGEEAIATVEDMFFAGTLWNDTKAVPLVRDEYNEDTCAGEALEPCVVDEKDADDAFTVSYSVATMRGQAAARRACEMVVNLYLEAEELGDTALMEKLRPAYAQAEQSVNQSRAEPLEGRAWDSPLTSEMVSP